MNYTYQIEEISGPGKLRHRAVIFRDGNRVSSHRTSLGEAAAIREAVSTIKFYEKRAVRDAA